MAWRPSHTPQNASNASSSYDLGNSASATATPQWPLPDYPVRSPPDMGTGRRWDVPGHSADDERIILGGHDEGRQPAKGSHRSLLWWTPELLWLLVGYGAMAAIAAVLAGADDKPPPNWPLGVTLNTFLAFFSSLAKMAFMFPIIEGLGQLKWLWFRGKKAKPLNDFQLYDEASRGAYGSFILLVRFKGFLACFGALITLSGFFTSTVTQQAIDFPTRLAPSVDGAASVHRLQRLSMYNGTNELAIPVGEILRLKQAVLTGAYVVPPDTVPHLAPNCTSGECRWEQYATLGVCAAVANLTAGGNATLLAEVQRLAASNLAAIYNQSKALADDISRSRGEEYLVPLALPILASKLDTPSGAFDPSLSGLMISDGFLAYSDRPMNIKSDTDTSRLTYLEIGLHWCTKVLSTEVTNGRPVTREVRTLTRPMNTVPYNTNFAWEPAMLTCYVLGNCNDTLGNTEVLLESPLGPDKEPFAVHVWSAAVASAAVVFAMGDSMLVDQTRGIIMQSGGGVAAAWSAGLYGDFLARESPPPEVQRANVQMVANNIALAVMNLARTGDVARLTSPSGNLFNGTVLTIQPFVQIRWGWISLLAAQIFLASLFLVATVIETYVSKVQILKGSSLATLSGLDGASRESFGGINDYESLTVRAKSLRVRLEQGPSGAALWLAQERGPYTTPRSRRGTDAWGSGGGLGLGPAPGGLVRPGGGAGSPVTVMGSQRRLNREVSGYYAYRYGTTGGSGGSVASPSDKRGGSLWTEDTAWR